MKQTIDELLDELGYIDTGVRYGLNSIYLILDKEDLEPHYFDTKEMVIYGD